MPVERNATLVRRIIDEIWNNGDLDLADALFAPTYVNHAGLITDLVQGPEAIKVSVAFFRTAFPDFEVSVDELRAEGDTVMLRWTASRHRESQAIDGAAQTLSGTTLSHVERDQVAESWVQWDALGEFQGSGMLQGGSR